MYKIKISTNLSQAFGVDVMLFQENPLGNLTDNFTQYLTSLPNFHILAWIALLVVCFYLLLRPSSVYLVSFSCYKPPNHLRAPIASFIEHYVRSDQFDEDSIEFLKKVYNRSGVGGEACVPPEMNKLPPGAALAPCLDEVKTVLYTLVEDILGKNRIQPKSIDILVVNCGAFCPTPSMTAMIINKFEFRSNVRNFSLTGMGCSSGLLSVNLAKDLLTVHKNSLALILSLEAITPNGYAGKVKSMLLTNTLFRSGGVAILLSNRRQDKSSAKYVLQHLVRTNMSSDDRSYRCVYQDHDDDGIVGVSLSKDILNVAANALRRNMQTLAPLVLPYSEQVRYAWSFLRQIVWPWTRPEEEVYVPDFKKAFDHFCIHAGGRAVVNAVEENLGLSKEDVEPSRMSLYRFGNTSSSSVWYALCYMEAKGRVKRGDLVWQIAFGSGFKCNSAVWKCLSDSDPGVVNAWSDRIHFYPVEVPE